MKQLQNNFTTPEQSKRLLELGLPADSADCFYGSYVSHPDYIAVRQTEFETEDDALFRLNDNLLPCWSVGRLMEIVDNTSAGNNNLSQIWDNTLSAKETSGSYVNYIVEYIADNITQLDFSKLEE